MCSRTRDAFLRIFKPAASSSCAREYIINEDDSVVFSERFCFIFFAILLLLTTTPLRLFRFSGGHLLWEMHDIISSLYQLQEKRTVARRRRRRRPYYIIILYLRRCRFYITLYALSIILLQWIGFQTIDRVGTTTRAPRRWTLKYCWISSSKRFNFFL